MKKEKLSEDQVKKVLGINSFRELSKDKITDFIELIPNMDSEVAKAAILQFPQYAELASDMVGQLNTMCDKAISSADASQIESIKAYKMLLEEFSKIIEDGEITEDERHYYTEKMIEVADKIALKDTEQKEFLKAIGKGAVAVAGGLAIIGAGVLGVTLKKKR